MLVNKDALLNVHQTLLHDILHKLQIPKTTMFK